MMVLPEGNMTPLLKGYNYIYRLEYNVPENCFNRDSNMWTT